MITKIKIIIIIIIVKMQIVLGIFFKTPLAVSVPAVATQ
jgi:hypothetical protein